MIEAIILAAALQGLDARIEQGLRATNTASLAVAVVQNDRVVYQRSFGATPDTRFYLASVPKSLTGLTLRMLAEEKKLDLDAPLTTTLPQLKLPAPLDPARMSVRDLLTHRLGFENDAVTYRASYSGDWSDEEVFRLMERYTVPTPRVFRYDNLGFMLATYAAERASGASWWMTLDGRVLRPAGMTHTNNVPCTTTKTARTMNRGSGGLCSTIGDMTRWLRVNMTDGFLDGKRVFPLRAMREVHAPQVSLSRRFGRLDRYAYGLGWYLADYQGDVVVHHFGSYPQSWAHVSWMPDRGIGVVVLANEMTPLPDAVAMLAYDTLIGRSDAGSRYDAEVQELRALLARLPTMLEDMKKKIAADAADSDRTLTSYAGIYVDDAMGTMVIAEEEGSLRATIGDRSARLERVRGDAFIAPWFPNDAPARITFATDSLTFSGRTFLRQ
jgi:CubicO group peptidase (beta-lactamase class C family)